MKQKDLQKFLEVLQRSGHKESVDDNNTWAYAVKRNVERLVRSISEYQGKRAVYAYELDTPVLKDYQEKLKPLIKKYAVTNEAGDVQMIDGQFQYKDPDAFFAEEILLETDEVKRDSQMKADKLEEFDNLESDFQPYKIKRSLLPKLTPAQLEIEDYGMVVDDID